ncbi:MAG: NAD(P) transhydrogenase subunit alpha part 1 [Verrucomicrobia bacterium ADurb.Bin345]|nr:MAG: NAD(P) transhydrogenase subunit alpha part 1 [Verrucomicrobia bacterium ADurb.Bin345]
MTIFVPRETVAGETRIPLLPSVAKRLVSLGAELQVEAGLGAPLGIPDADFAEAGAGISSDRAASLRAADLVLRLNKPATEDVVLLKKGCIHVSLLDPFNSGELLRALADAHVSAIAMDMIPRTTLAQKMDVLSSQANLAGYVAVILATSQLNRILPMMMTPAGTKAIATAKRLGARVEAFDTRPVVEEQVKSLGAKFVKIDLGETGQTKDGYAKALTEEQLRKQREGMAKVCAESDIVITTAQVFGRKAPQILTTDMVRGMKPGSVVVDMAVESGGNVECSRLGDIADVNGVKVIGYGNLPGRVPVHASQMYASNIGNMVEHFWDKETKTFALKLRDEIIEGCLVTHDGAICPPALKG